MVIKKKGGSLTSEEKPLVKAMINSGWRNQDIVGLINIGRKATINSARITETKKQKKIKPSNSEETKLFIEKKKAFEPQTELNPYFDERIYRAREAMTMAVSLFNNPTIKFRTEIFAVLSNIAWTYALHEFYLTQNVKIIHNNGNSLLLSQMIGREDCPLSKGVKANLSAIKEIRDDAEHKLIGSSDLLLLPKFQACCLNFDKFLRQQFGEKRGISNELSQSLFFAQPNIDQVSTLLNYDIPPHILATNTELDNNLTEDELNDTDYQFKINYTISSATKGTAHITFVSPESSEGKSINNILIKHKISDHLYPYKPKIVVEKVCEKSGIRFTSNNHTRAWKLFKARPASDSKQPEHTNHDYCIYHTAHKDYTYSEAWINLLVDYINDKKNLQHLKTFKIKSL
jgi:hypothetical protein